MAMYEVDKDGNKTLIHKTDLTGCAGCDKETDQAESPVDETETETIEGGA